VRQNETVRQNANDLISVRVALVVGALLGACAGLSLEAVGAETVIPAMMLIAGVIGAAFGLAGGGITAAACKALGKILPERNPPSRLRAAAIMLPLALAFVVAPLALISLQPAPGATPREAIAATIAAVVGTALVIWIGRPGKQTAPRSRR